LTGIVASICPSRRIGKQRISERIRIRQLLLVSNGLSRAPAPWCSDNTSNSFDDFKLLDLAGPKVIDARWFGDAGEARVIYHLKWVLPHFR